VACGKDETASGEPDKRRPQPEVASGVADGISGIDLPDGLSDADQKSAELAARVLVRECALGPDNWPRFAKTKLEMRNESGYRFDEFDWQRSVWITLIYRDGIRPGLSGHHLLFHLGAGKRPGIITGKRQAKELCGFTRRAVGVRSGTTCSADVSEDCYLEIPELADLDAGRPASVVPGKPEADFIRVFCFGYGFDPPEFWKCGRTAAECNKLRKAEKREENEDYRVRTTCQSSKEAHCFTSSSTQCTPTADTCVRSRKQWLSLGNDATPCETLTDELLRSAANDK
jgi:hypothetical protein